MVWFETIYRPTITKMEELKIKVEVLSLYFSYLLLQRKYWDLKNNKIFPETSKIKSHKNYRYFSE